MTLVDNALTSQSEMERLVGTEALVNWCDHDDDEFFADEVLHDFINEATQEIMILAGSVHDS